MQIIAIETLAEHVEIVVDKALAVTGKRWGWNNDAKKKIQKLIRRLKKAGKKVRVTIGWTGSYQSTVVSEGRIVPEIGTRPADWDGIMSYATRGRQGYSAFPGDSLILVCCRYNTYYDYHPPDGSEYLKNRYELKTVEDALAAIQQFAV